MRQLVNNARAWVDAPSRVVSVMTDIPVAGGAVVLDSGACWSGAVQRCASRSKLANVGSCGNTPHKEIVTTYTNNVSLQKARLRTHCSPCLR